MRRVFVRGCISLVLITTIVGLSGCSILKNRGSEYSIDLEVWGVFDDRSTYTDIFNTYEEINPFVRSVSYRKFTLENYESDLLDALASGQGPDIFLIPHTALGNYENKIVAAPPTVLGEVEFRDNFVDVVSDDFMRESQVYGVPLTVDSLALYYNRDFFNAAGIVDPPKTWDEFVAVARQLTVFDNFGEPVRAGVALGTADNINRSTDILGALSFQNNFGGNFGTLEGQEAMEFYTQFSDPDSGAYMWNSRKDWSIDAFIEGGAAMMINYSWHVETVKQKNEKLRFGVSELPQLVGQPPANYANYWGYVVSKSKDITPEAQSKGVTPAVREFEAWQFLRYLSVGQNGQMTLTNASSGKTKDFALPYDPATVYAQSTKKPAARRDIIATQFADPSLEPFARGNLLARSYPQSDREAVEAVLAEAIRSVNFGRETPQQALSIAAKRIRALE